MNLMPILEEASNFYNIEPMALISIFKQSVQDELGTGDVIDRVVDGELLLYEEYGTETHSSLTRKIEFTSKRSNYLRERFYNNIIDYQQKTKITQFKERLSTDKVLLGKIIRINAYGINVMVYGIEAFAPLEFLNAIDFKKERYKIGNEMYWHVYKMGIKKNIPSVILDRKSTNIPKRIIYDILGLDFEIVRISRKIGVVTKIYIKELPEKEKRIKIAKLIGEKAKFIKI